MNGRPRSSSEASQKLGLALLNSLQGPTLSRKTSTTQLASERGSVWGRESEGGRESIVSAPSAFRSSTSSLGLGLGAPHLNTGPLWATLAKQLSADAVVRKSSTDSAPAPPRPPPPPLPFPQTALRTALDNASNVPNLSTTSQSASIEEYPDPDDEPDNDDHSPLILTRPMLGARVASAPELAENELDPERNARVASWIGQVATNQVDDLVDQVEGNGDLGATTEGIHGNEVARVSEEDVAVTESKQVAEGQESMPNHTPPSSKFDQEPPACAVDNDISHIQQESNVVTPTDPDTTPTLAAQSIVTPSPTHCYTSLSTFTNPSMRSPGSPQESFPLQQEYQSDLLDEIDQLQREVEAAEEDPLLGNEGPSKFRSWRRFFSCLPWCRVDVHDDDYY